MKRENLLIRSGETFEHSLEPLGRDLSSASCEIYFRDNVYEHAKVLYYVVDNISLSEEGVISMRIESEDTYEFSWLDGGYDVWLFEPGGQISRPFWGTVEVRRKAVT